MTRSKLSASDREDLIRLFRDTNETITSLANRFQVSISTARRVLKTQLSADEYETIVTNRQQRKSSTKAPTTDSVGVESPTDEAMDEDVIEQDIPDAHESTVTLTPPIKRPKRRSRRRSSAPEEDWSTSESLQTESLQTESLPDEAPGIDLDDSADDPIEDSEQESLEILPIESVVLPNQCYLVVDRASELITPPLREFSELGAIPSAEETAKTLPIFANHKIASRFSRRSQRIIKIPDSGLLKKTYPMLTAKGVERILFDGQVFSLVR